jgi:Zn-dependent protease
MNEILLGLLWYVVLLFALTFHEAAHAWAARRGGDPTAYHSGQVSLDPLPHIRREPMGTVLVPLLSYAFAGWMIGWASTPFDVRWADAHPRRAAWMSLAGPGANLVLVLASGLAIRLGVAAGIFHAPEWIGMTQVVAAHGAGAAATLATLLSISFTLNLLLLVFNLIPLPPLDGSGAIGLLLPEEAARSLRRLLWVNPHLSLLGLLGAWFLIEPLFHPIHLLAVNLLYPGVRYG